MSYDVITWWLSTSLTHVEQSEEEQLKQLATSPPFSALEQVLWVLGVVYDSVKLLKSVCLCLQCIKLLK